MSKKLPMYKLELTCGSDIKSALKNAISLAKDFKIANRYRKQGVTSIQLYLEKQWAFAYVTPGQYNNVTMNFNGTTFFVSHKDTIGSLMARWNNALKQSCINYKRSPEYKQYLNERKEAKAKKNSLSIELLNQLKTLDFKNIDAVMEWMKLATPLMEEGCCTAGVYEAFTNAGFIENAYAFEHPIEKLSFELRKIEESYTNPIEKDIALMSFMNVHDIDLASRTAYNEYKEKVANLKSNKQMNAEHIIGKVMNLIKKYNNVPQVATIFVARWFESFKPTNEKNEESDVA